MPGSGEGGREKEVGEAAQEEPGTPEYQSEAKVRLDGRGRGSCSDRVTEATQSRSVGRRRIRWWGLPLCSPV